MGTREDARPPGPTDGHHRERTRNGGAEDRSQRELRPTGRASLLPSRDSSCAILAPSVSKKAFLFSGARGCAASFHAGFGGGFGVDLLEGYSRVPAHGWICIG